MKDEKEDLKTPVPSGYGTVENPTEKETCLSKVIATLITVCLINFGDGVEIYLPAILTEVISCDLVLTTNQEGFLAIVMYSFYAVGTFCSGVCANTFGRRKTLILSMFCSMIVSFTAAGSHTFWLLLISRGCTGLLVGSNRVLLKVYWVETAPKKLKDMGIFFIEFSFSAGAGYTCLLAYYTLDLWGWRTFFLISSLPIFVLPTISLLFYLEESETYEKIISSNENKQKTSFITKLVIAGLTLAYFINIFHAWGLILFTPKIYQEENLQAGKIHLDGDGCNTVSNDQVLKMAVIFGLGPCLAKCLTYAVYFLVGYPAINMILASVVSTVGYFTISLASPATITTDIILGTVKFAYVHLNLMFWFYIINIFQETQGAIRANALFIIDGIGKLGAVAGTSIVAFTTIVQSGLCMAALGIIQGIAIVLVVISLALNRID